jgi:hypothetical protein
MDRRKELLLNALKSAALARGEVRLYRRGKLPGLFGQRTRLHAEAANQAVQDGLLESVRVEPVGQTTVEWVRITQKGLDLLLESESPARALEALRETLAVNQQGLPVWAAHMQARIEELACGFTAEVAAMHDRLAQMAQRVNEAIERIEAAQTRAPMPATVPWAREAFEHLDRRQQVGLGQRCSLADLFAALKERHAELTIKEYHAGLRSLQERGLMTLLPSTGEGDTPGPEYALLDGPAVHYYVERSQATSRDRQGA